MRIGVIGSGALGLYYGSMLQRAGHEVRFLLRRDLQAIQNNGLQIYSINGDFHLPQVQGFANPQQIGPVDMVLIGLKTFANQHLVELVRPLVAPNTYLLTLQNGLGNEELLAEAFGAEKTLGGVAFLCSHRGEPGSVKHLGEGKIRLGEFSGGLSPRSQQLAELFQTAGVPCEAVADLRRARWEKLAWNIPFNGLSALLNQDVTRLLAELTCRQLIEQIMLEVASGGNAQGFSEPIDGPAFAAQLLHFTDQMDHYQPSMQLDRQAGRPLELEAILQIPLQQATARDIEMPRTAMLYTLLRATERQ